MALTVRNHDRYAAGRTYVYPVVSRRARGVSVGINLNPNQACNWRCIYCQVPELSRGIGPTIDLALLEREFTEQLDDILEGDFLERLVPEGSRRFNDVAFSGDGEPTSSPDFEDAVRLVARLLRARASADEVKLVLITNGSLVHTESVQRGLTAFGEAGGIIWYKLDAATDEGLARLNDARGGVTRSTTNLQTACSLARTWLQTMVLAVDGEPPRHAEREAYKAVVSRAVDEGWGLEGIHLYGLARQSFQPEAERLSPVTPEFLETYADELRALGLEVTVSP